MLSFFSFQVKGFKSGQFHSRSSTITDQSSSYYSQFSSLRSLPFQLTANRCVFGMLFSITSRNTTQDDQQVKWSVILREISLSVRRYLEREIFTAGKLSLSSNIFKFRHMKFLQFILNYLSSIWNRNSLTQESC